VDAGIATRELQNVIENENFRVSAGGDKIEFRVSDGVITILPKLSTADDDDYAQRRVIDGGIAKGLEDIRKGRVHGPFENTDQAIAHLRAHARSRRKTALLGSSR
jgi:hypothetical protein